MKVKKDKFLENLDQEIAELDVQVNKAADAKCLTDDLCGALMALNIVRRSWVKRVKQ